MALGLLGAAVIALAARGLAAAPAGQVPGDAGMTVAAPAQAPAARLATVRVAPGDTLWGIAMRHAPAGADPRPWIFRTATLNDLHDAVIVPGQILRLPAGSR